MTHTGLAAPHGVGMYFSGLLAEGKNWGRFCVVKRKGSSNAGLSGLPKCVHFEMLRAILDETRGIAYVRHPLLTAHLMVPFLLVLSGVSSSALRARRRAARKVDHVSNWQP